MSRPLGKGFGNKQKPKTPGSFKRGSPKPGAGMSATKMTESDVQTWVSSSEIELPKYSSIFKENNIDGGVLITLTESDLEKMGIESLGHRRKIVSGIGKLKKNGYEKEGNNNNTPVKTKPLFSGPKKGAKKFGKGPKKSGKSPFSTPKKNVTGSKKKLEPWEKPKQKEEPRGEVVKGSSTPAITSSSWSPASDTESFKSQSGGGGGSRNKFISKTPEPRRKSPIALVGMVKDDSQLSRSDDALAKIIQQENRERNRRMGESGGEMRGLRGVQVPFDEQAKFKVQEMKQGSIGLLELKIANDTVKAEKAMRCSVQTLSDHFHISEPRFYVFEYTRGINKDIVFIYSCPESAPNNLKMTYASSKTSVVHQLKALGIPLSKTVETSNPKELTPQELEKSYEPVYESDFKAPPKRNLSKIKKPHPVFGSKRNYVDKEVVVPPEGAYDMSTGTYNPSNNK